MDTKTLVERAMEKTGCSSKNQLATKLGIHSGLVSDWINGKRTPDAAEAGLLAKAAGLDPVKTMFEFEAQHEKNPVKKALWNDLARAAVFFVAVSSFFTTPTPSEGSNGAASGLAAVYHVKSYWPKSKLSWTTFWPSCSKRLKRFSRPGLARCRQYNRISS